MTDFTYLSLAVLLTAIATWFTRAIPFIFLRGNVQPPLIRYLAKTLPPLIMLTLVIYSLQDLRLLPLPQQIPAENGGPLLIASLCVVGLHLKWRNVLVTICASTALYMALIHPSVQGWLF